MVKSCISISWYFFYAGRYPHGKCIDKIPAPAPAPAGVNGRMILNINNSPGPEPTDIMWFCYYKPYTCRQTMDPLQK